MTEYLWKKTDNGTELWADGMHIATVPAIEGCTDKRYHVTSWNLCSWMGAFRMVALDMIKDWDVLR